MAAEHSVPSVNLGDELSVSAIGFGAMALTPVYGEVDDTESLATLHRTLDLGVTFIDTANVYGNGDNERLISQLLADRRDEVTLATKFGIASNPAQRAARELVSRGDAAYVRQCLDESLQRLQTEVVDLYYMHRRDPSVPIEETVGAMAELVAAGKVRHLGLSEVTADELRAAVAVHPISAVQSEWSIWSRDVEANVVPTAAELGVGFVPYSPLGRGFLTGTISSTGDLPSGDFRRTMPRFGEGALDANLAVVELVKSVAAQQGATPAQVALAWLRYRAEALGVVAVPIPGTRRAARVEENRDSLSVTLTPEQLDTLDAAAAAVTGSSLREPRLGVRGPRIAHIDLGPAGIPSPMIEVTLLGTGSPIVDPNRAGPSTLVRAGDSTFLVDCGRGALMRAGAVGVGAADITALLLTHLHSDHITDLSDVITTRWVTTFTRTPLPVIGPPGTAAVVEATLAALAPDISYRIAHHADITEPPVIEVHEYTDGPVWDDSGVTIRVAPTCHRPVEPYDRLPRRIRRCLSGIGR